MRENHRKTRRGPLPHVPACTAVETAETHPHIPLSTFHQGKTRNDRCTRQKLVLGTHTSEGEQNYLMLAEVRVRQRG